MSRWLPVWALMVSFAALSGLFVGAASRGRAAWRADLDRLARLGSGRESRTVFAEAGAQVGTELVPVGWTDHLGVDLQSRARVLVAYLFLDVGEVEPPRRA